MTSLSLQKFRIGSRGVKRVLTDEAKVRLRSAHFTQRFSKLFGSIMALTPYLVRGFWDDPLEGISPFLSDEQLYPMQLLKPNYGGLLQDPKLQSHGGGLSEVVNNDREFRVNMDVQHFKPEEINVKTKDNRLIVNARHEEKPDEHGFIMREFTRQYVLPKDVDPATLTSSLNRDGVLTLKAPKMALEAPNERTIPVMREERKPITHGHSHGHKK